MSSIEAAWGLLGFPLQKIFQTVLHHAVHLENGQCVCLNESTFQESVLWPLGRVYTELVTNFERFCLRILLH